MPSTQCLTIRDSDLTLGLLCCEILVGPVEDKLPSQPSFSAGPILQVTSKVANRINRGRYLSKKLVFVCVTAVKSLIVFGFYLALVLVVYLNGRHVALQRLMDSTLGN